MLQSCSLTCAVLNGINASVLEFVNYVVGAYTFKMALFRSDILNQEFFRKAVQSAEKTSSVEILELTIGDAKTGLQVF